MLRWIPVSMACLAGCTSAEVPRQPAAPHPQPPPRVAAPMPITFGACSSEHSQWVSGPRPVRAAAAPESREAMIEQARAAGILGNAATGQQVAPLTGTADPSSGFDDTDVYGGLLGNGTGSVGSGGGWGTIGTGRYGTLGHGKRNLSVPLLMLDQPVAKGGLDKAIVRRYLKRNLAKLQYCYEKQLLAKPGIQGTIVAHFSIAPSGDVTSATVTGFDPDVASCVDWVIKSIQFPKPKDNGRVEVTYPIEYRPGQASPAPQAAAGDLDKAIIRRYIKRNIQKIQYCYEKQLLVTPGIKGTIQTQFFISPSGKVASATGSGFDPTVASCVAGVIKQIQFPKPRGGGGVQVNYPFVFHESGDAPSSAAPPPPPPAQPAPPPPQPQPAAADPADQPSAANPLQPLSIALEDCFRQNPVPYGAVVVELHYGASRAVSSANVYGLDGAAARACVIEVAKRTRPSTYAEAQRCSLAFGQMPASALPAIAIANGAITFDGHSLTMDALGSELAAPPRAASAPDGQIVSIQGTVIVRPDGATPMSVVYAVLDRVRAAHRESVLAARRGADWRLVRDDVTLPAVPVPLDAPAAPAEDRVKLSVYIGKNAVSVGVSRVNEFHEVALGPELAEALKTQKINAFFSDRTDIEIGADDDVSFADVVSAIDAATTVGFTDWRLLRPQELSARLTP